MRYVLGVRGFEGKAGGVNESTQTFQGDKKKGSGILWMMKKRRHIKAKVKLRGGEQNGGTDADG